MSRTLLLLACFTLALAACHPAPVDTAAEAPRSWSVSPDLQVSELRPGVWLHTSWQALSDGTRFPSNGLLVREGDRLVLVDTAWGEERTGELLQWIDSMLRLPIARAVITHSHDDRIGGASLLVKRGIPFYAHPLTRQFATEQGLPLPEALEGLTEAGGTTRIGSAEVFYPGPAHARDNVMVWLPESGVLFGTCAVRAAGSTSLGNVADADVPAWPAAIRRTLERYGEARVVVPGHGKPGGSELLRHTLTLFPGD
jgi:metallo-beta-lactamase class B VIM